MIVRMNRCIILLISIGYRGGGRQKEIFKIFFEERKTCN